MIELFFLDRKFYIFLLFWIVVGVFSGPLAFLIIPIHLLFLYRQREWLWILLGIWFIFTLSDSRQFIFLFSQTVKILMMGVLGVLFFLDLKRKIDFYFFSPFALFFGIAGIAWLNSPIVFDSFMKMSSYALLLLIIPWLVNKALLSGRNSFLIHLVLLGTLVLLVGLILRVVSPSFVIFIGGRFSGLLGNPNGLGIYSFLFFLMVTLIFKYHRNLFSTKERIVVYGISILSIVLSGSRGGLFATLLFLLGWYLFGKSKLLGFVMMTSIFISYQLIVANIDQIASALSLEAFLRIETLKTGSGRLVAQNFALDQIQKNYWVGKGFGFGEYLMKISAEKFLETEHQGNIHNSYLTIWLDTGLIGLIAFCYGWISNFIRAAKHSSLVWALFFGILLSTSVESWLSASLNPFTIQLVIILSLASHFAFHRENDWARNKTRIINK